MRCASVHMHLEGLPPLPPCTAARLLEMATSTRLGSNWKWWSNKMLRNLLHHSATLPPLGHKCRSSVVVVVFRSVAHEDEVSFRGMRYFRCDRGFGDMCAEVE